MCKSSNILICLCTFDVVISRRFASKKRSSVQLLVVVINSKFNSTVLTYSLLF